MITSNLHKSRLKLRYIPAFAGSAMTFENTRHCSFTARLDCRYLLHTPEAVDDRTMLVVTLHGFSANPEVMLRLTALMMGPRHVIAAVQGPNQFYLAQGSSDVGYGWSAEVRPGNSQRVHDIVHAVVLCPVVHGKTGNAHGGRVYDGRGEHARPE